MGSRIQRVTWKGHIWGLALVWVLAAGCAPSGPQALRQGVQLIRQGRYQEAVVKLDRAVQQLPDNAQAWNHLGLAYQGAQQPELAAQAYLQALKLNRQLAAARYNLGCLRLAQNHPAEAVTELTTFTLMQPESAEGWRQLGLAQMQLRQLSVAIQSLERAIKLRENHPEAWNALGLAQVQKGQPREALHSFTTALRYQSNYGPALLNQAVLYQETFQNRTLALQKYREYLALRPLPPQAAAVEQLVMKLDPSGGSHPAASTNVPAGTIHTNQLATGHSPPPTNLAMSSTGALDPLILAGDATASNLIASAATPPAQADDKSLTNKIVTRTFGPVVKTIPTNEKTASATAESATVPIGPTTKSNQPPPEPKPSLVQPVPEPKPPTVAAVSPAGFSPTNTPSASSVQPVQTNVLSPPVTTEKRAEKPVVTEVVQLPEPETIVPGKEAVVPVPTVTNIVTVEPPSSLSATPEQVAPSGQPAAKASGWSRLNPLKWGRSKTEDTMVTPLSPLTNRVRPAPRRAVTNASTPVEKAPQTMTVAQVVPPPTNGVAPAEKPVILRYPHRFTTRPASGNRQAASVYFSQGLEAHNVGSNKLALAAFQRAAVLDPAWFEAHYNAALMASQTGELGRALREYEIALAIDPESTEARYHFALALAQANYSKDAAQQLELLLGRNLADPRVHLMLGNLYAQQLYEPQKARQHYWKVLEIDPQNPQAPAIRSWLASHP